MRRLSYSMLILFLATLARAQDVPPPSEDDEITKQQLFALLEKNAANVDSLAKAIIEQQQTIRDHIAANVVPKPTQVTRTPATVKTPSKSILKGPVTVISQTPKVVTRTTNRVRSFPSKSSPTWYYVNRSMTYSRMAMANHLKGPPHYQPASEIDSMTLGQLWYRHDSLHQNERRTVRQPTRTRTARRGLFRRGG